jgi:hypothetical protein
VDEHVRRRPHRLGRRRRHHDRRGRRLRLVGGAWRLAVRGGCRASPCSPCSSQS